MNHHFLTNQIRESINKPNDWAGSRWTCLVRNVWVWIFSESCSGFMWATMLFLVQIWTWVRTCQLHANLRMQIHHPTKQTYNVRQKIKKKGEGGGGKLWPRLHTSITLFEHKPSFSSCFHNWEQNPVFWEIRLIERFIMQSNKGVNQSLSRAVTA